MSYGTLAVYGRFWTPLVLKVILAYYLLFWSALPFSQETMSQWLGVWAKYRYCARVVYLLINSIILKQYFIDQQEKYGNNHSGGSTNM